ncbi:DUF1649-domain-containing protein [Endogone sp. FLAS-F59071]|nr:DUF1649-domain-containing protein [Endogone sp. FLAS-F59071]|eukprot:RUS20716.1 DUF1649-domain-containing protein [Endogone sp. FLAS-F59071]
MAPEVFPIEITADRAFVKDVLKALLHAILFHRVFATIRPRDFDVLDTTVSAIDDTEIDNQVEEKVNNFARSIDWANTNKGQIAVMFYEKRPKKGWFGKQEEEVCWEQWAITIIGVQPQNDRERQKLSKSMEKHLNQCLEKILRIVNEKKEHIPPITSNDGNPFPFQVCDPRSGIIARAYLYDWYYLCNITWGN